MSKPKRKSISKKIRFEVLKRDRFVCQYCGESAPDVVLQIDHIKPVASGGSNGITNLITSCFNCNSGKGKRELSDHDVAKKQHARLSELQDRREQLEMIKEWHDELMGLEDEEIDIAAAAFDAKTPGRLLSAGGRKQIKSLIKRFGLVPVLESIDISTDKYLQFRTSSGGQTECLEWSVERALNRIGGICYNKKNNRNAWEK